MIWITEDSGEDWHAPDGLTSTHIEIRGYLAHRHPAGEIKWTEQGPQVTIRSMTYAYATLGEISTGAQNDLLRATDIARAMVTEFGMSDELGAINYDGNKRPRFLDIPLPQDRGLYGEETAQKIDAEIKRILNEAHATARQILSDNRDKLENVTRRLLEVEVMEGDELRQILTPAATPRAEGTA